MKREKRVGMAPAMKKKVLPNSEMVHVFWLNASESPTRRNIFVKLPPKLRCPRITNVELRNEQRRSSAAFGGQEQPKLLHLPGAQHGGLTSTIRVFEVHFSAPRQRAGHDMAVREVKRLSFKKFTHATMDTGRGDDGNF